MKKIFVLSIFTFQLSLVIFAQPDRWQQRVKYTMNVDMNVQTNQFTGKQKLEYTNNSPDTLTKVFYHLYFNAFQPGSMMDTRSRRQGADFGGGGGVVFRGVEPTAEIRGAVGGVGYAAKRPAFNTPGR